MIDEGPNILQEFKKILCHVGGFILDVWLEFGQDAFGETFLYHSKEPFEFDCVDNGMSGCELGKQAKAHGSPFAPSFLDEVASDPASLVTCPGTREDCDKS